MRNGNMFDKTMTQVFAVAAGVVIALQPVTAFAADAEEVAIDVETVEEVVEETVEEVVEVVVEETVETEATVEVAEVVETEETVEV